MSGFYVRKTFHLSENSVPALNPNIRSHRRSIMMFNDTKRHQPLRCLRTVDTVYMLYMHTDGLLDGAVSYIWFVFFGGTLVTFVVYIISDVCLFSVAEACCGGGLLLRERAGTKRVFICNYWTQILFGRRLVISVRK